MTRLLEQSQILEDLLCTMGHGAWGEIITKRHGGNGITRSACSIASILILA